MTDAPRDFLHRLPTIKLTRPPRDIPTLFNASSIRALRAGRKTKTRRLVTPRNTEFTSAPKTYWDHANFDAAYADGDKAAGYLHVPCHRDDGDMSCAECTRMGREGTTHRLWPRVERGDRLWVREAHYLTDDGHSERAVYAADADTVKAHFANLDSLGPSFPSNVLAKHKKLRPSIHMPRWASRIALAVTEVRIERVQSISEEDAIAEGLVFDPQGGWTGDTTDNTLWRSTPRDAYAKLWDRINGSAAWAGNPWVVTTSFKVGECK